ncbi:nitric oxide reductase transcriptional regulator NorR [Colwellia sp. Bg11-28]|nr:nitric oxide reductase transcriptional regulator NorR [Colwellia sp. Bg11-28]
MLLVLEKTLLKIALDLSLSLPKKAHYQRLMLAVNEVMPCDAVALLVLQDDYLVPVAVDGLSPEVLGMRFSPEEHPRLKAILSSRKPIRFDADSSYPDPYDGLLSIDPKRVLDVHDCMGCCLYVEENLVGVLTLDALQVGAFSNVDDITVATLAALAAATIRNANCIAVLEKRNEKALCLTNELVKDAHKAKGDDFVGESPKMLELKNEIKVVANSELSVLITGETGVGKEVVARTVHAQSRRSEEAIVQINCAALSENIAESELFGHVKGSFTGANKDRMGKFELANHGTLFLDEIGELSLNLQAKLLRAIQEGEIQRVGADKNFYVDVRIIAATNRDLSKEVAQGRFREDLYHRLSVFPLNVPSLRERIDDIPQLSGFILNNIKGKIGTNNVRVSKTAMHQLMQYDWPGNVRELQHVLMRAALRAAASAEGKVAVIELKHLGSDFVADIAVESGSITPVISTDNKSFNEILSDFQRQLITQAMEDNDHVWAKAARQLQLDRGNLYRQAKRLGLT